MIVIDQVTIFRKHEVVPRFENYHVEVLGLKAIHNPEKDNWIVAENLRIHDWDSERFEELLVFVGTAVSLEEAKDFAMGHVML